jgi:catalase (peroxidase I)
LFDVKTIVKRFTMMNLLMLAALVATGHAFSVTPGNVARPNTMLLLSAVDDSFDRRAFLANGAVATVAATIGTRPAHAEDNESSPESEPLDYKAVANDISQAVKDNPDWGPTLVRLAWHASGTYDKMSKTGGSGSGTLRFKEELAHGGNAGLADTAVKWMEPIHAKYAKAGLSYADLYTLAGVASIKTMGGPTIPWSSGRVDALDPAFVTPDGRLPNADSGPPGSDPSDAAHLRTIFNRMGFNDQ